MCNQCKSDLHHERQRAYGVRKSEHCKGYPRAVVRFVSAKEMTISRYYVEHIHREKIQDYCTFIYIAIQLVRQQ